MHHAGIFYCLRVARSSSYRMLWLACLVIALTTLSGCGKRPIGSGDGMARPGASALLATVRSQIGVPYLFGGMSPKTGFDCSGLLYWSFRQHGVRIPRTTAEQADFGRSVGRNELLPGDIVVFRISAKDGLHTGIASGGGRFIHSPRAGARVREESLSVKYWQARFVSGRRIL